MSFGSDRTLSPGWGLFQGGDDTPGLSDSVVSEQADFLVEQIARGGIADDDLREELRSALKARRENTALRDHIERIKNEEVGMGLEASKRMAELSAEYMSQVDELKKEKEAARERAEAAEEEAKMLAEMMRANGFATLRVPACWNAPWRVQTPPRRPHRRPSRAPRLSPSRAR